MIMAVACSAAYRPTRRTATIGGEMHVEIRPTARLRGKNAVDLVATLGPALDAVIAAPASRTYRVTWITSTRR